MTLKKYLNTLKVQDLKDICKKNNIIGISKLKKSALIETMIECELKDTGYNPDPDDYPDPSHYEDKLEIIYEEEPIILHLPLPEENLKSIRFKKFYHHGKQILEKLKH